ncbi:hypothetical protein FACS189421_03410 [Bacteroidia bacterium]|nr:hypothetical protein FACS189421_03410 [Bacteroidia bacterium]
MEQEKIKQLLEQYWQCKTSREDEQWLQEFFSGNTVPDELKKYKSLFAWKAKQQALTTNTHRRIVPEKRMMQSFYPALKIAASVLIVMVFGISVYTHFEQEKFMNKVFSETTVESPEAVRDSGDVVAKAVPVLVIPERIQMLEDSLKIE